MRVPERLEPLLDHGVIEEVLRPLMSGKEAEVYLVLCEGQERVAKVYKNAQFRSFQHRAEYTEGRRVRSSREQRAMGKRSKHGREKTEEAWRSAEVDAIYRLREAGVRVPEPFAFTDGVLVMELITGDDGEPAPRMVDINFSPEDAEELFLLLIREVVKMLCAGLVHADLSDFNILMSGDGPVIIDFPQAIDPASNQGAKRMLLRDVKNLSSFLGRFAPKLRQTQYGPEMWELYERSELEPDTELTGTFKESEKKAEVSSLLEDILELEQEARERREALGLPPPRSARRPIVREPPKPPPKPPARRGPKPGADKSSDGKADEGQPSGRRRRRRGRGRGSQGGSGQGPNAHQGGSQPGSNQQGGNQQGGGQRGANPQGGNQQNPAPGGGDGPPKKKRRRRRRRGGGGGGAGGGKPQGSGES